jgi:hypothetical protein
VNLLSYQPRLTVGRLLQYEGRALPWRIDAVRDELVTMRHLSNGYTSTVHISRLDYDLRMGSCALVEGPVQA